MKEGSNIWHWILLIAILGSAFFISSQRSSTSLSAPFTFPTEQQKNTIAVTGSSDFEVAPDQAEIILTIETNADTAKAAQDQNSASVNSVIASLKSQGISKDKIETTSYYLQKREYFNPQTGKMVSQGYTQIHSMRVTVEDLEITGEIVDAATNAGANRIDGISFSLSKQKQKWANEQALKQAAENAEEKAKVLADALNVNLGKTLTISETNYIFRPVPMPYYGAVAESVDMKTQIPSQDVTVSLTVNVIFLIQ